MASKNSTFKVFAGGLVLGVGVGALAGAYLSGRGLSSLDTGPTKAAAEPHKQVGPRDRPPVEDPKDKPTVIDQGAKPGDKPGDNATPTTPQNPGDKPESGPNVAPPNTTPPAGDPAHGVDPKSIDPK